MNYAVIRSGGKQYRVNVGDVLELDRLAVESGKAVVFDDVLLIVNDGNVSIGKPKVAGAKIEGKLVENKKGDKIRVMKFKAKSRYRKATGFRPHFSVVKIEKISAPGKVLAEKIEKRTKTAKSAPKSAKK